ncbi:hypothetical protein COB72_00595 [bacterium]|nr:MAG: hypothetical protein COB72_00595 [bacterium]
MHKIAIAIIAASGFVASADIVRVDEFNSLQFEGFNDLDMGTFDRSPVSIFDGMGEALNTAGSFLHATSNWALYSGDWSGRTAAYEGGKMLGTSRGGIEYRFSEAQKSFGGYFSTIADVADAEIKFYNGDDLVGSDNLIASVGGDWSWNGWSSNAEFDRITVDSNYGSYGGFLMHDAVRVLNTEVPTQGSLAIIGMGVLVAGRRRR